MLALDKSIYYVSNLLRFACEKAGHSTANYAQNGPQTIPTSRGDLVVGRGGRGYSWQVMSKRPDHQFLNFLYPPMNFNQK